MMLGDHHKEDINHDKVIGPRILVAGNIVGWGGPKSPLFSNATPTTYFDELMMDYIAQGSGEELLEMSPDELRVAINNRRAGANATPDADV